MSKRQQSKYKINRRLGVNLWGRPKSSFNRREYGPGQHGQARRRKPSDFGLQLMAKQKLKGYYGNITEKQFRRYFARAERLRGDTGLRLIQLLEARLDAVIYRMKFVPTVFSARQFVSHGHVKVNGQRVTIPSYAVSPNDVIEITAKMKENPVLLEAVGSAERDVPEYVQVDYDKMTGTYVRIPDIEEVPYPVQMEPNLVIEYYSR
ncbi:MAG: 30S ribosomal protein S4 [Alphaproteobacteria bacterium]